MLMGSDGSLDELVEERPDIRLALVSILEVDARKEYWTFEDINIDQEIFD